MKAKKEKATKEVKLLSNKKVVIFAVILVIVIVTGFLLFRIFLQAPEIEFSLKAAIIDQLGEEAPNPEFNETVTSILENAGFNVSYHKSESITVEFFRELAKYNYGIIVLRAHSALRIGETEVDIFTSEEFIEGEYKEELNNGLLTRGYYSWEEPRRYYFAITSKFIENLEGYFPKSIVITMGCNTLNETCTEMAKAFFDKGAKAYIGWTGLVESSHTDSETLKLLGKLLNENKTIYDAVSEISPDFTFYPPKSEMNFYPSSAGNLRISDLIIEAKATATSQITFNNLEQSFQIHAINIVRLQIKRFSDLTLHGESYQIIIMF